MTHLSHEPTTACILGLGAVGLPLACVLADRGLVVTGVDTNQDTLRHIHQSQHLQTEDRLNELFKNAVEQKHLTFREQPVAASTYLICVPTPSNEATADLTYVNQAIDMIQPYLSSESLIIIESTCPIGTTEALATQLAQAGLHPDIAYCPERILPGQCVSELNTLARIVGGINHASTARAKHFYTHYLGVDCYATNAATAEMVKLAENTFRDVNIAYANELSMIAAEHQIDIQQVINLANHHPRVNVHQPGIGVGGHCIPVDPYFLSAASTYHDLILTARQVNQQKTLWVIQHIKTIATQHNVQTMGCLGLSYKPDVADTRNSPAIQIVNSLATEFSVLTYDPYQKNELELSALMNRVDCLVILVAHQEFLDLRAHLPENFLLLDMTGNNL